MAKLYNKDGKEFNVPHAVDIREWKKAGFSEEKPGDKEAGPMTAEEFEGIKESLGSLKADELKRVAAFADVEYTNIRDTLKAIKEKFDLA